MAWQDLDIQAAEWRIPDTKNGDPLRVPLAPEALAVLDSRRPADDSEPSGFVFPGGTRSGHMWNPKKGWRRVLGRAGIADLRIHDLRRSLGSWQAKTGASLAIIGKSLGHKTASATMIYARLDQDPVREAQGRAIGAMLAAGKVNGSAEVASLAGARKAKARAA